jgi:predicted DNA-binding protein (MmcQ/YjbR family)
MTLEAVRNRHEASLRKFALSFPEAVEEFPWGHRAIKVRNKTFVFLAADAAGLSLSVKLPRSRGVALTLPFAKPTGYGLGKSGWVTASFPRRKRPPLGLLEEWIEESYRAIAPKRLLVSLRSDSGQRRPMRTLR